MMISFCQILFATTIIYVLPVNGDSSHCPDGEEDAGDGISCKKCEEGFFRNGGMPKCQKFKICDSSPQEKLFNGNETHDVVCHCPTKPFTVIDGKLCLATCPEGEYFINASCQPCPPEKWKNFTGKDSCLSCTQCSKILYECNSTHDAVCELTTESNKNNSSTDGHPSTGASSLSTSDIIIIVFVLAAVVGIGCVVAFVCWRRRKRSSNRFSSSSSREERSLLSPQNSDQNKSNAIANSLDTSTNHQSHLFSICCLPHRNNESSQRLNDSQQNKNSNPKDDSKPNETPGQPMVELNSEVDPQVVVNPTMVSALLQHTNNPEPQQNENPNDNSPASGIRDREDPGNQNANASQPPNDSQQNRNNSLTDASKSQISVQPGGELNLKVDPQVDRPTSSASLQLNPAHDNVQSSLCTNPLPSISSNHNVSFPGVAEARTTPSFEQPASQDNVDIRDERSLPTSRPSSTARKSTMPEDLWDYEDCITKNYILIRDYLTSLEYILGSLLQKGILTHPQMLVIKEIERNKSKGDAIDQLIKSMRLKGNRGFECFIEALVSHEVKLDFVAKLIHPELAERCIKKRDSEDTEDQDSKTEPPRRKASSEGKDEVDFGKSGADETKIKAVGSDETQTKILGSAETIIKAIDSDETEMKVND